jgi:hypothetical protein
MRRMAAIGAGALAAIVLVAQIATADPASMEAGPALTYRHVLNIALTEARDSADHHPKRIEMATGLLKDAVKVMDPTSGLGPVIDGRQVVDMVVMHGYFHVNAPHPSHSRIAPGKVMELIIGAHTGFVQARSLGNKVPVPLSHLGRVTRLR